MEMLDNNIQTEQTEHKAIQYRVKYWYRCQVPTGKQVPRKELKMKQINGGKYLYCLNKQ